MAITQLKSRITELEAEVAHLKAQIPPPKKPWWDEIAGTFANDPHFDKAMWYGRQWRQSFIDIHRSPQLTRLRKQHRALISKLKALGKFKTKTAAADYAHREFS